MQFVNPGFQILARSRCTLRQPLLNFESCWRRFLSASSNASSASGYSKEDQTYLLELINKSQGEEIPSKAIGNSNAVKIKNFLSTEGRVNKLEDLLNVQGIGPRTLKKICDKLLNVKDSHFNEDSQDEANSGSRRSKTTNNIVSPMLDDTRISQIKTVVSIHVGTSTLSWAHLDCQRKEICSWRVIDLPEDFKKLNLLMILEMMRTVSVELPQCDIHVFEDINWYSQGSQTANSTASVNFFKAQLVSVLFTLLENKSPANNVWVKSTFLKARITARLFNRVVGTEKVSSQILLEEMFRESWSGEDWMKVGLQPEARLYYNVQKGYHKEVLSYSCLQALAFLQLVIFKRVDLLTRNNQAVDKRKISVG